VTGGVRTALRGIGQTLVTAGVVVLLFAAYELYGTGIATARAQHELLGQLRHHWAAAAGAGRAAQGVTPTVGASPAPVVPAAKDGQALAVLRIPRLGRDWTPRVVVEGVTLADLRSGPGHYPGTALPGQVGNFAVAGHRATHGNGFFKLNELRAGDAVVVETAGMWFTYRVSSTELVDPSDVAVIAAVPDHPGQRPTQPMVTLTTCDPWYSATHRLIVHGLLQSATVKSAGLPAALRS